MNNYIPKRIRLILEDVFTNLPRSIEQIQRMGYVPSDRLKDGVTAIPTYAPGGDDIQQIRNAYFDHVKDKELPYRIESGVRQMHELEKTGQMALPFNILKKAFNTDAAKLRNFYTDVRDQVEADKLKELEGSAYFDEWMRQHKAALGAAAGATAGVPVGAGLLQLAKNLKMPKI